MISVSVFEAAAQGYLKGYPLNKQQNNLWFYKPTDVICSICAQVRFYEFWHALIQNEQMFSLWLKYLWRLRRWLQTSQKKKFISAAFDKDHPSYSVDYFVDFSEKIELKYDFFSKGSRVWTAWAAKMSVMYPFSTAGNSYPVFIALPVPHVIRSRMRNSARLGWQTRSCTDPCCYYYFDRFSECETSLLPPLSNHQSDNG